MEKRDPGFAALFRATKRKLGLVVVGHEWALVHRRHLLAQAQHVFLPVALSVEPREVQREGGANACGRKKGGGTDFTPPKAGVCGRVFGGVNGRRKGLW